MAAAQPTRLGLLRAAAALGVALVSAVTACTSAVDGSGSKADPLTHPKNATAVIEHAGVADDVELEGTLGTATDDLVINAMSDLISYWSDQAQDVFGVDEIPPLEGGVWAIDSQDPDAPTPPDCLPEPADYQNNAVYCGSGDVIAYDVHYLASILEEYGDLDVAFVFAHEYGHALQARFSPSQKSIVAETQADCFTGAWARSVTAGKAQYWLADEEHLDGPVGDYVMELGDPAGQDPDEQGAHGGVFDRVSAIQEGYFDGPTSCVSNFDDDRVFASAEFDGATASTDGMGNVDLDVAVSQSWQVAEAGLAEVLDGDGPELTTDDAACKVSKVVQDCPEEETVEITDLGQLEAFYDHYGDFSVFTVVVMTYAAYAEQSQDDEPSTARQVCAVAALADDLSNEGLLSPGDLDEAVTTVFRLGPKSEIVEVESSTAWERIDAFRTGYYEGLTACGF